MLKRRSPLVGLDAPANTDAALSIHERAIAGAWLTAGWAVDAVDDQATAAAAALGLATPPAMGGAQASGETLLARLTPLRQLAVTTAAGPAEALERALDPAQTVAMSYARSWLRLSGPAACALLDVEVPVDLRASALTPGAIVQSRLAQVDVIIHAACATAGAPPAFDVLVARSLARHLVEYLVDVADIQHQSVALTSATSAGG